jgi:hypothetical protein
MINTPVIIGTIVVYMGICLFLGFAAWRRTHNLADFILGGRSLGSWVTAFSAQASDSDLDREPRRSAGARDDAGRIVSELTPPPLT